jgi:hypothetical protein
VAKVVADKKDTLSFSDEFYTIDNTTDFLKDYPRKTVVLKITGRSKDLPFSGKSEILYDAGD